MPCGTRIAASTTPGDQVGAQPRALVGAQRRARPAPSVRLPVDARRALSDDPLARAERTRRRRTPPSPCRASSRRPRRSDSGRPGRRARRRPRGRAARRAQPRGHASSDGSGRGRQHEHQREPECARLRRWPEGKLEPVTACRCSTGGRGRDTSSLTSPRSASRRRG